MYTYCFRSFRDSVRLVGVNHQVGFPSYKKRIATFPIPILHLVLSTQVLQCFLCDVDSPNNNNNNNKKGINLTLFLLHSFLYICIKNKTFTSTQTFLSVCVLKEFLTQEALQTPCGWLTSHHVTTRHTATSASQSRHRGRSQCEPPHAC